MNLQELETKYKELGDEIELLKTKSHKRWRAKIYKYYWYLGDNGTVFQSSEDHCATDDNRYHIGNYYETEEEAKKEAERQLATFRIINKLRELEGDWKADWNNGGQPKYIIFKEHNNKQLKPVSSWSCQNMHNSFYSTKKAWEQVIRENGFDIELMLGTNND